MHHQFIVSADQTRPDQTRPDQTRTDQIRPDQRRLPSRGPNSKTCVLVFTAFFAGACLNFFLSFLCNASLIYQARYILISPWSPSCATFVTFCHKNHLELHVCSFVILYFCIFVFPSCATYSPLLPFHKDHRGLLQLYSILLDGSFIFISDTFGH